MPDGLIPRGKSREGSSVWQDGVYGDDRTGAPDEKGQALQLCRLSYSAVSSFLGLVNIRKVHSLQMSKPG